MARERHGPFFKKKLTPDIRSTELPVVEGHQDHEPAAEEVKARELELQDSPQELEERLRREEKVYSQMADRLASFIGFRPPTDYDPTENFPLPEQPTAEEIASTMQTVKERVKLRVQELYQLREIARKKIADMKGIEVTSENTAQQLDHALEPVAATMQEIRKSVSILESLEVTFQPLPEQHLDRLIQEQGFQTIQEVHEKRRDLSVHSYRLKDSWLGMGRWAYRKKIRELEQQYSRLTPVATVDHERQDAKAPHIENSRMFGLTQHGDSADVSKLLIAKIIDHYKQLLDRTEQPEGQTEEHVQLSTEDIDNLNRDLFDTTIDPELRDAFSQLSESDRAKIGSYEQMQQQARAILNQGFAIDSHARVQLDEANQQRVIALNEQIQALPYQIRMIIESDWHRGQPAKNDEFERIVKLLSKIPEIETRSVVLESLRRTQEHFERALNKPGAPGDDTKFEFDALTRQYADKDYITSAAIIEQLDMNRLKTVINHPAFREKYGAERMDRADGFVGKMLLGLLQETPEHTDRSVRLSEKLMYYNQPEIVPFTVLNAYREPGYSGESPFLSIHARPEETELCTYLLALTNEQVAELEGRNVPGLSEVVHLIRENPTTFRDNEYADGKRTINPVRQAVHEKLKEMALHIFTTGDSREKRFSISTLPRLDVTLSDDEANRMFSQLYGTQDQEVIEAAIKSMTDAAKAGKPQTLEKFLSSLGGLDQEVQDIAKDYIVETCNQLLRKELSPEIEIAASHAMGISAADFRSLSRLLAYLDTSFGYRSDIAPAQFTEYAALARNPDTIPVFTTLLNNHHCRFSASELQTFIQLAEHREELAGVSERLTQIGFAVHKLGLSTSAIPGNRMAEELAKPEWQPFKAFPIEQPEALLKLVVSPERAGIVGSLEKLHAQGTSFENINRSQLVELLGTHPHAARHITSRLVGSLETLRYAVQVLPATTAEVDLPICDQILGRYSGRGPELVRKFVDVIKDPELDGNDHLLAAELLERTGIIGSASLQAYKQAKAKGNERLFEAKIRLMGDHMVSTKPMPDDERNDPLYTELLEFVYPNNAHQWFKGLESCEDRTEDLAGYNMKDEYMIDIQPSSEMKMKDGQKSNEQLLEQMQQKIARIQQQFSADGFDPEKMKARVATAVTEHLASLKYLPELDLEQLGTSEEKLFAGLLEAVTQGEGGEGMRDLLLMYEFANFQDVRDYMQGTRDRVGQASTPDYALLGESHTFFSDELKHVIQTIAEKGGEKLQPMMPKYFEAQRKRQAETQHADKLNRIQLDKVGLTPGFLQQLERVLKQKPVKGKPFFLVHEQEGGELEIGPKAEVLAGIIEGQQKRTAAAIEALTGEPVDPGSIHLGTTTLDRYLEAEQALSTGTYDEKLFQMYLGEQAGQLFGDDIMAIQAEMDKYEAVGTDRRRERLRAVFSKTKESAYARAVGGVCVTADNPAHNKEKNMWNMPEYFQLVLQDPETKRSQGLVLLHTVQDGDERILTASFNPSSTFVYTVNESELFSQLTRVLAEFAADNNIDAVAMSTNRTIRTNRTGGQFEKALDERVTKQGERITLEQEARFSFNPNYSMKDLDVIWRRSKQYNSFATD